MQQRKFHYLDAIAPAPRKRPALRLANDADAPVRSAALDLQDDIALAFDKDQAGSTGRVTATGVAFHLAVAYAVVASAFGSLGRLVR